MRVRERIVGSTSCALGAHNSLRALGLPVHVRLRLRLRARDERVGEQHSLRSARQTQHAYHEFVAVGERLRVARVERGDADVSFGEARHTRRGGPVRAAAAFQVCGHIRVVGHAQIDDACA